MSDIMKKFQQFLGECSDIELEVLHAALLIAYDGGGDLAPFDDYMNDKRVEPLLVQYFKTIDKPRNERKTWLAVQL